MDSDRRATAGSARLPVSAPVCTRLHPSAPSSRLAHLLSTCKARALCFVGATYGTWTCMGRCLTQCQLVSRVCTCNSASEVIVAAGPRRHPTRGAEGTQTSLQYPSYPSSRLLSIRSFVFPFLASQKPAPMSYGWQSRPGLELRTRLLQLGGFTRLSSTPLSAISAPRRPTPPHLVLLPTWRSCHTYVCMLLPAPPSSARTATGAAGRASLCR